MADNTVQVRVTAKDEASATLAKVAKSGEKMASDIKEGIGTIKSGMSALSGDFSRLGDVIGGIGGPAGAMGAAVVGALGGIITKTMEAAEGFRKLSEKTGAGVEFLSGFTQAADDVFVSSETVSASLTIFAKKLGGVDDAMDGSGITAGAFAKKLQEIGINSDNIEEALMTVADRFAGMANGADKTALAVQLFGKQGSELIPILNKGAAGIKDMMTEAKSLGLVLGDEATQGTTRLKQGLDKLNDRLEGIALRAGPGLIGFVADAIDAFDKLDMRTRTSFAFGETNSGNNLASKILGVARTYKTFTEVNDKFIPTLSVSNQALHEQGDWATKAGNSFTYLTEKTYIADRAYQQMYGNLNYVGSALVAVKDYTPPATSATYDLALALARVNDNAGQTPKVLDAAAKATAAYRILLNPVGAMTGDKSEREKARDAFAQQQAYAAITQAIIDQTIGVQGLTKAQGEAEIAAIKAQAAIYKPAKDNKLQVGLSAKQAAEAIDKVNEAMANYSVTTGISEAAGAKLFLGLKVGTLDAEQVLKDLSKNGSAAVKRIYQDLKDVDGIVETIAAKPTTIIRMHSRWDNMEATLDAYSRLHDKTVTVTINSNAGSGIDTERNMPGDYANSSGSSGGGGYSGGAGSATYIPPSPYGNGNNYENGGMTFAGGGRGTPGKKDAAQFNVNNPGIVINSVNGAAIAQQIARQNANVARRARARASLMG